MASSSTYMNLNLASMCLRVNIVSFRVGWKFRNSIYGRDIGDCAWQLLQHEPPV